MPALPHGGVFPFLFNTLNTRDGSFGHAKNRQAKAITAAGNWWQLEPTQGNISAFTTGAFQTVSLPDAHNYNYKILLRIRAVSNGPIGDPENAGHASWMFNHGTKPVARLQIKHREGPGYIYVPTWFRRHNQPDASYDNYRFHRNAFYQGIADYLDGPCPVNAGHKRSAHIYFIPVAHGEIGTEMWCGYGTESTTATYNRAQYDKWGTETQRRAAAETAWREAILDFNDIFVSIGIHISLGGGAIFNDGQVAGFNLIRHASVRAIGSNLVCMQTNLQVGSDGKTWYSFSPTNAKWAKECIDSGYEWGFQTAQRTKLGYWDTDAQRVVNAFEDARATYKTKFIEGEQGAFNPLDARNGDAVVRNTAISPPYGHLYHKVEPDWDGGAVSYRQYIYTHANNLQSRMTGSPTTPLPPALSTGPVTMRTVLRVTASVKKAESGRAEARAIFTVTPSVTADNAGGEPIGGGGETGHTTTMATSSVFRVTAYTEENPEPGIPDPGPPPVLDTGCR